MKMKRLSILIIVITASFMGLNAQNYKWWAGGRALFWTGDAGVSYVIAPEVGYQLTPKWTIASSLGIQANNFKNGKDIYGIVVNPYLRYLVFKQGPLLGFVDGGVEFGLGDILGFQLGFKPGIALLLTERFTVATQFGFVGFNDGKQIGIRRQGFGYDFSGYCSTIAFFYSF